MARREAELDAYLARYGCHYEYREKWPIEGEMVVRLSLAQTLPPAAVSSSILSIVVDADRRVLFLWPANKSSNIAHLLVGGRPDPGETPEETAVREVGEETGWRVEPVGMIGFRHFWQTGPKKKASDRPYPHFIQPVYAARAVGFDRALIIADDEIAAEFIEVAAVRKVFEPQLHPLLDAAVEAMNP